MNILQASLIIKIIMIFHYTIPKLMSNLENEKNFKAVRFSIIFVWFSLMFDFAYYTFSKE